MDAFVRWLHVLLFSCEQVLIFAEKKADVDAIHEYLLLKGVEAVAIHGGKGTRLQTALPRTLPLALLTGKFCQVTSRCHLCSVSPRSGCLPDQEERTKAIEAFKEGKKDVLVATDVASKGLDFPAIQHVVNYDMPEEIENYGKADHVGSVVEAEARPLTFLLFLPLVHRIGRTGRSGKTGIATTFINKGCGKEKKRSEHKLLYDYVHDE